MSKRRGENKSKANLAKSIHNVLTHKDTPPMLRRVIESALDKMNNYTDKYSPEMIERNLSTYKGHESEQYEIHCENDFSGGN